MAKLWILFLTFLKIGAFTFGGGYAMIPLITGAVTTIPVAGGAGDYGHCGDLTNDAGAAGHQRGHIHGH